MNEVPELISIPMLAKQLSLKESHVRNLVFKKKIPFIKIGRLVRFKPDEVIKFLEAQGETNEK